jgi:site-specific DNA-methyltransferase (adenine-specific)
VRDLPPPPPGFPSWRWPGATLVQGDNLAVMAGLPEGAFDLVYVDPPYASGRVYRRGEAVAFDDRERDTTAYLATLRPRLEGALRLLRPGGTLWVHVDPRRGHYVRVLLDEILGERAFRNEVVWCYNGGAVPRSDFPRKHDTLFRYVKPGGEPVFNVLRRPYKENTQAVGRHSTRARTVAIDLSRGTPLTDWWVDIPTVTGWSPERTGFQTQKPVALLERVIATTSRPGDLVADFYAGSGTTLVAALRLGRRAFGVDVSPEAVALARARLEKLQAAEGRRGLWY